MKEQDRLREGEGWKAIARPSSSTGADPLDSFIEKVKAAAIESNR